MNLLRAFLVLVVLAGAAWAEADRQAKPPDSSGILYHLKYIEKRKPAGITFFPRTPGVIGTEGGGISKRFTRCRILDGTETCGDSLWIGLFGERLYHAVEAVPEARREAKRIGFTTGMQGLSLAALPVFFYFAFDAATRHEDEDGTFKVEFDALTLALSALTVVSIASYIGWDVHERAVVRKTVRLYNAGIGVKADARSRGGQVDLSYRF